MFDFFEMDGDVVLIGEFVNNVLIVWQIVFFEIIECCIGKDDVEVEGFVGVVVFIDCDVVFWFEFFQQDCEIEFSWVVVDDCCFYRVFI